MAKLAFASLAALALLSACNKGPAEKAGEAQDTQVEAATGTTTMGDGPAENAGEVIDQANSSAMDPAVSAMDQTDLKADAIRTTGEAKADRLENQADAVRDGSEAKADAVEDKANAVKDRAAAGSK